MRPTDLELPSRHLTASEEPHTVCTHGQRTAEHTTPDGHYCSLHPIVLCYRPTLKLEDNTSVRHERLLRKTTQRRAGIPSVPRCDCQAAYMYPQKKSQRSTITGGGGKLYMKGKGILYRKIPKEDTIILPKPSRRRRIGRQQC